MLPCKEIRRTLNVNQWLLFHAHGYKKLHLSSYKKLHLTGSELFVSLHCCLQDLGLSSLISHSFQP